MRSILLIALALVLIFIDTRHWFPPVRSLLSFVVYPIQYAVNLPNEVASWTRFNLVTRKQLLNENAKLREQQLLFQVELQKVVSLRRENEELRALLSAAKQINNKVIMAKVLAVAAGRFSQEITLDRGKGEGLYIGQPVLDAHGVLGQVVAVDLLSSQALLITDPKSAVPVVNARTGMQAIIIGANDHLELLHIPDTADVQVGDLLVTSELAAHFPYGYLVGVITAVTHNPGAQFTVVKVKPSSHIGGNRFVLLVIGEKK